MVKCRCGRSLSEHDKEAPFAAHPDDNTVPCEGWRPVTIRPNSERESLERAVT